jgi:hypothetical protein
VCQIGGGYVEAAESELRKRPQDALRVGVAGANQEIDIRGVAGNPCHETASAPTTRYSTSFEFKHSINSRKSLLKGIGVGSLSQFEEYAGPLLRGHLSAGKGIGGIGFLKGVENADYFLHSPILRWLFDFGGWTASVILMVWNVSARNCRCRRLFHRCVVGAGMRAV